MICVALLTDSLSQLISVGGLELANSRRYFDLTDFEAVRWQYQASSSVSVRLDYSLDDGASFTPLCDEYQSFGSAPRCTTWQVIPDDAKTVDVLIRAFVIGTGLLTTVNFVQVDCQ